MINLITQTREKYLKGRRLKFCGTMHWKPAFKKRKITLNLPIVSFASLAIDFMNIRTRALPLIGILCFPLIFTVIRKLIKMPISEMPVFMS